MMKWQYRFLRKDILDLVDASANPGQLGHVETLVTWCGYRDFFAGPCLSNGLPVRYPSILARYRESLLDKTYSI